MEETEVEVEVHSWELHRIITEDIPDAELSSESNEVVAEHAKTEVIRTKTRTRKVAIGREGV